ncbi:MAG: CPBP family intramembrane metalloprotease [Verrucomicrobiota bacterium JB023]|nr:CPBP family intramembrane metalloprotease [Verrucomicrobiota bacterium JB023]
MAKRSGWLTRELLLGLRNDWKPWLVRAGLVLGACTGMMMLHDPEKMFLVPRLDAGMWVTMILVYSFLSVYPQEFLYRLFFFARYQCLFRSVPLLITANAVVFSLAHLMFWNALVMGMTLVGGFLFAFTYQRTKSLLLVSLEHALYGSWIFTLGMGEMLAFPMPE